MASMHLVTMTLITNQEGDSIAGPRRKIDLPGVPRVGDTLRLSHNWEPSLRKVTAVVWDEATASVSVEVES